MTLNVVGWLLDAGTEHERTLAGAAWVPSRGGTTNEPMVLRVDAEAEIERMRSNELLLAATVHDVQRERIRMLVEEVREATFAEQAPRAFGESLYLLLTPRQEQAWRTLMAALEGPSVGADAYA